MRTPLGIGLVVLGSLVLTGLALLHLALARRGAAGKWGWATLCVLIPYLGAVVYFIAGRRDDEPDVA